MRTSACVIIIRHGLIAVIRSAKHDGAYELPGGKAEPGESPQANAIRECKEEVGVEPRIVQELLCEMDVGGYLCSTFLGEIDDGAELVSGPEGEAIWVTFEEMLTGTYAEHSRQWLALPVIQQRLFDTKLIKHTGETDNEDDPTLPFKLEMNLSPPDFMRVAFVSRYGGSEEIVVRGMSKEALDRFMEKYGLRRHSRLRRFTITGPNGIVEEMKR